MPERTDHRSAVVRLLHHNEITADAFDSVMFHFDHAIEQAQQAGREQCVQLIVDKFGHKVGGDE